MTRDVVVTGIGIICSIGNGKDQFWDNCLKDTTITEQIPEQWRRYSRFNSSVWAPLPEVEYEKTQMSRIEQKQLDPVSKNAVKAAFEAMEDSGLTPVLKDRKRNTYTIEGVSSDKAGVFMGTGVGGIHSISTSYSHQICSDTHARLSKLKNNSTGDDVTTEFTEFNDALGGMIFPKRFNPYSVSMLMPNAAASNVAIKLGITGPNLTYAMACASGTGAIGHGARAVASGEVDLALAGGSEYLYDAYGTVFRSFDAVGTLTHDPDGNEAVNRPFDKDRCGFLFSQGGAAILVLEEKERALKRGAQPIAQVEGYAESCDASSVMTIDESATQIKRMLGRLLEQSGTDARDIDYINTHGTGTRLNDHVEAGVIKELFRDDVLVNSTKALTGHPIGAAGAIEAAVTALSLQHQKTHGSPNLSNPLADLNFKHRAGPHQMSKAISQSFAFGGHNTALLMTRYS